MRCCSADPPRRLRLEGSGRAVKQQPTVPRGSYRGRSRGTLAHLLAGPAAVTDCVRNRAGKAQKPAYPHRIEARVPPSGCPDALGNERRDPILRRLKRRLPAALPIIPLRHRLQLRLFDRVKLSRKGDHGVEHRSLGREVMGRALIQTAEQIVERSAVNEHLQHL